MYHKIIIGIDQSYTSCGISVCCDGKLKLVRSIKFAGLTCKSEKRIKVRNELAKILAKVAGQSEIVAIYCERIRTFSQGASQFISTKYIKATGALIATIVDLAYEHDIPVYSVDTRAWKSQVLGTSKSDPTGKKVASVRYIEALGFDLTRVSKKGKVTKDDDAADASCIALYGFIPEPRQKLMKEF